MRAGTAALLLVLAVGVGDAQAAKRCGTKQLYGRSLPVVVRGDPLSCERVRAIVRGRCADRGKWACFSFHPPDPVLVWFRKRERFERVSTAIEARRYPCRSARVTRRTWRRAYRRLAGFPTRAQVLADDIARCDLLRGYSRRAALRLLGKPTWRESSRGKRYLAYDVGPERGSFFQVDSEVLLLRFDGGAFEKAEFAQT